MATRVLSMSYGADLSYSVPNNKFYAMGAEIMDNLPSWVTQATAGDKLNIVDWYYAFNLGDGDSLTKPLDYVEALYYSDEYELYGTIKVYSDALTVEGPFEGGDEASILRDIDHIETSTSQGVPLYSIYLVSDNPTPPAPSAPTFELDASDLTLATVSANQGMATFQFYAGLNTDGNLPYDTTSSKSIENLSIGDCIQLVNFECDSSFDGTEYTGSSELDLVFRDASGQVNRFAKFLYAYSSDDYITLDKTQGDTVSQTFYVTQINAGSANGSISLTPPPASYTTSLTLDGYNESDTIYVSQGETLDINVILDPSGSQPISSITSGTNDWEIINPSYNNSNNVLSIEGLEIGTTTVSVYLPLEAGYTTSFTYNVVVTGPSTDFELEGYASGSTISMRAGNAPQAISVVFSPSNSIPTAFTVNSSNTGAATVAYADGVITVTPVAAGNSTLTATLTLADETTVVYTYTIVVEAPIQAKALGGNAIAFLKDKIANAGGGIIELTEADYDAVDSDNTPCLGLWALADGIYKINGAILTVNRESEQSSYKDGYLFVETTKSPYDSTAYSKVVANMGSIAGNSLDFLTWSLYSMDTPPTDSDWAQAWPTYNSMATESSVSSIVGDKIRKSYDYNGETPLTQNVWGQVGSLMIWISIDQSVEPQTETASLWFLENTSEDAITGEITYNWVKLYPPAV